MLRADTDLICSDTTVLVPILAAVLAPFHKQQFHVTVHDDVLFVNLYMQVETLEHLYALETTSFSCPSCPCLFHLSLPAVPCSLSTVPVFALQRRHEPRRATSSLLPLELQILPLSHVLASERIPLCA